MKKFLTMGVLSVMTLVGFSASALADDDRTEAAPTTYYQERVYGQPMHAQPGCGAPRKLAHGLRSSLTVETNDGTKEPIHRRANHPCAA